MKPEGLLLSYYPVHSDAKNALKELSRKGYARMAMLHRPMEGGVRTTYPHRFTRVAMIFAGSVLLGLLVLSVASLLGWMPTAHLRHPATTPASSGWSRCLT